MNSECKTELTGTNSDLHEAIPRVLRTIYDPEIPVDIFELGLIYRIDADDDGAVAVTMTLTAPGCPVAGELVAETEAKVADVQGVSAVTVDLVWDPPWTPDRMSDVAKLSLGMF
jgi:FeS assembly SUF system protein